MTDDAQVEWREGSHVEDVLAGREGNEFGAFFWREDEWNIKFNAATWKMFWREECPPDRRKSSSHQIFGASKSKVPTEIHSYMTRSYDERQISFINMFPSNSSILSVRSICCRGATLTPSLTFAFRFDFISFHHQGRQRQLASDDDVNP